MSHLSEGRLDELIVSERTRQYPPLNHWDAIAARARSEGLIREDDARGWSASRPWMQAAAAVLLLVGGIAIGRTTIALPGASPDSAAQSDTQGTTDSNVSTVSQHPVASFRSVDEAWETLNRAGTEYQQASAFLAANNAADPTGKDSASIYGARLAAFNQVMNATRTALESAPHDPVINQYYLATMGAREAAAQRLGAVQPAGLILKGF
jgi:hypothetical protein